MWVFAFGLKTGIGRTLVAQRRDRQRAGLDCPCVVEKLASKSVSKIPRRATKNNANQLKFLVVQVVRLEGFEPQTLRFEESREDEEDQ